MLRAPVALIKKPQEVSGSSSAAEQDAFLLMSTSWGGRPLSVNHRLYLIRVSFGRYAAGEVDLFRSSPIGIHLGVSSQCGFFYADRPGMVYQGREHKAHECCQMAFLTYHATILMTQCVVTAASAPSPSYVRV